jgi:hypothetical protein
MSAVITTISADASPSERGQQLAQALLPAFLASCDVKDREQALAFFGGFHSITLSYAAAALDAASVKAMTAMLNEMIRQNEILCGKPAGHA